MRTDQQADTQTMIYDLAGRLIAREYRTGGTTLESTDTFDYDAASRLTESVKGRYGITTEHGYAADSMPVRETFIVDGRTYESLRDYDAANRPISHTYPNGRSSTYGYDARNLISSVEYVLNPKLTPFVILKL